MNIDDLKKKPNGLVAISSILFFTIVGIAALQSSLVLYLNKVLHFTDTQAYQLVATYIALLFSLPLLGGYIGNKILGYKNALILGVLLSSIGLIGLSLPGQSTLLISLACILLGFTTISPNVFVLLGHMYQDNHSNLEKSY